VGSRSEAGKSRTVSSSRGGRAGSAGGFAAVVFFGRLQARTRCPGESGGGLGNQGRRWSAQERQPHVGEGPQGRDGSPPRWPGSPQLRLWRTGTGSPSEWSLRWSGPGDGLETEWGAGAGTSPSGLGAGLHGGWLFRQLFAAESTRSLLSERSPPEFRVTRTLVRITRTSPGKWNLRIP